MKAIILVGTEPADLDGSSALTAGVPLAAVDLLGRPLLQRVADRLREFGASSVCIVGDTGTLPLAALKPGLAGDVQTIAATGAAVWRGCESVFNDFAQGGAELVIVQRIGPYSEIDYEDLVQFHLDQRNRVTPVCAPDGSPLFAFCLSGSRRNDAAFLFRHQLDESRTSCAGYTYRGAVVPLRGPAALRQITMHAFTGVFNLKPIGREIRPGVWLGDGARIYRGARVLAPAFIGNYARIRPSAVVTRYTSIEHHCDVDCGTVVEDTNLLPYTYVGAGLDVAHAVVGNKHLRHLHRNVEVAIGDPKLIDTVSEHAPLRAAASAAALAAYLPKQFFRGLFPQSQRDQPASLPAAIKAPSAALTSPAALEAAQESDRQFPASLMVARRYGNE